jgi:hypothetical protein
MVARAKETGMAEVRDLQILLDRLRRFARAHPEQPPEEVAVGFLAEPGMPEPCAITCGPPSWRCLPKSTADTPP